jgi:acyl carrier protein
VSSSIVTRESIDAFVVDSIAEFGADRELITPAATFDDLEIDSLDLVELIQAVKKEFGIQLRPREFDETRTVAGALDIIYRAAGIS